MTDAAVTAPPLDAPPAPPPSGHSALWKSSDGPSFHDLLDTLNPFQHAPVIATLYRWISGDEPGNVARVAGDALYGGPIGAAVGLFNVLTRDPDEGDLGERALTWIFGPQHEKTPAPTAVAAAKPAVAPVAAKGKPIDLTKPPAEAPPAAAGPPSASHSIAAVAALYRASAPVPQGGAVASLTPRGIAGKPTRVALAAPRLAPVAPNAATPEPADPAARAFLKHTAMLQREIATARSAAASGPQLSPTPVPLHLTGAPQLQPGGRPVPSAATPAPAARAPANPPMPPVPVAPADISSRMLEALDKYMRLQQERHAGETAASRDPATVP
jgi:hypothetical protein